jgi:hypothetical protein
MKMLNNQLLFHPWGNKCLRLCKSIHSIETIISKILLNFPPPKPEHHSKIYDSNVCKLHGFVIWDLNTPIIIKISLGIPTSPKKGFRGGGGCITCSHHIPLKFPKLFSKAFPISPRFYPIWLGQSSTLMYINWIGENLFLVRSLSLWDLGIYPI